MIYHESIERSAEYLRQAIPLMSRQATALHPVSYAVWYDYVAQTNPSLRAAVDQHLAAEGQLDEAATNALFRKYVAEVDPQTAQRVTDGFQRVLAGMAESAAQAGDQTAIFDTSLTRLTEHLSLGGTGQDEPAISEALVSTRKMRDAVSQLQSRLEDSQQQITALREEVRRARHESLVDSLTGLANRRAFDQRLATCLATTFTSDDSVGPCLLVSDIDHFKRINDTFGHGFGDQVLRAVGKILLACAPGEGLAARVGGEEFAILLPKMPIAEAQALAEKIRVTIAGSRIRRQGAEDTLARVTVSLGVTPYLRGEEPRAFIERADKALYASKAGGRDRVTVLAA